VIIGRRFFEPSGTGSAFFTVVPRGREKDGEKLLVIRSFAAAKKEP
jgi:hypothetical protein